MARCDASEVPMLGKFLVGTVPCLLQFKFDNEYSWMREKVISYKVTVTPPSKEVLMAGRRRRAKACVKAVDEDLKSADDRLGKAQDQLADLEEELEALKKQMEQKQKSLKVVETEEKWLVERVGLRKDQQKLLEYRLTKGWTDEEGWTDDDLEKSNEESN
jgi:septal ring factor EnvC (AmiA/AmiB activator)